MPSRWFSRAVAVHRRGEQARLFANHPRAAARGIGALVLAHVLAFPAGAQLRGSVRDGAGHPVPGVAVEIWSPFRQLGVRASDEGGEFRFSREEAQDVSGILARRVGMKTAHLRVAPGDTLVVLRMESEPEALEGLTVTASRASCPNRETPRARALWTALRDRYRGGIDTSTISSYLVSVEAVGPREQVGVVDTTGASRGWLKSVHLQRRLWARIIATEGYAHGITSSLGEAYAAWRYPPLGSHYASHFVEDLFGEAHTLSIASEAEDEVVLRYCPRDRSGRRSQIEGTLTLAADAALLQATWKYRTPKPREDAGGEVDFAPPAASFRAPLLLPATSLYWRRTTGGRYYQRWEQYPEWRVVGYHDRPDWAERPGS